MKREPTADELREFITSSRWTLILFTKLTKEVKKMFTSMPIKTEKLIIFKDDDFGGFNPLTGNPMGRNNIYGQLNWIYSHAHRWSEHKDELDLLFFPDIKKPFRYDELEKIRELLLKLICEAEVLITSEESKVVLSGMKLTTAKVFPTPEGSTWRDVVMKFRNQEDTLDVTVKDVTRIVSASDLNMIDRRSSRVNRQYEILKKIAESKTNVLQPEDMKTRPAIQKQVETLARKLKKYFGIDEDPFENLNSTAWKSIFRIS